MLTVELLAAGYGLGTVLFDVSPDVGPVRWWRCWAATAWARPRLCPRSSGCRPPEVALGSLLSGGGQQVLAIVRALMTNSRLLILDQATEGLGPLIRAEIRMVLAALKADGEAILLIDKNPSSVLRLSDTILVVEKRRSVWTNTSAELRAAPDIRRRYLHL